MPAATYSAPNPRAMEPWSIESTLAPLAFAGDRSQLQSELGSYQLARQTAENQYGSELAQQHQFAYNQLKQQLQENYLKAVPEYAKNNVLGILASGTPQAFMGADPSVIADAIDQARAAQNAKNFAEGGKGAEGYSNAGFAFQDANQVPGLEGKNIGIGENVRLAAERLRSNAILGAAAIKAAASSGGDLPTHYKGKDADTGLEVTTTTNRHTTPAQLQAWKNKFSPTIDAQAPAIPLPPGPNAPPATPAAPATSGATTPPATPSSAKPASSGSTAPVQNTAAGVRAIQQYTLANQHELPKHFGMQGASDIVAGMKGNNNMPQVVADASKPSGYALVGATGKHY